MASAATDALTSRHVCGQSIHGLTVRSGLLEPVGSLPNKASFTVPSARVADIPEPVCKVEVDFDSLEPCKLPLYDEDASVLYLQAYSGPLEKNLISTAGAAWTEAEQQQLEAALQKYPLLQHVDPVQRYSQIAAELPGKKVDDVVARWWQEQQVCKKRKVIEDGTSNRNKGSASSSNPPAAEELSSSDAAAHAKVLQLLERNYSLLNQFKANMAAFRVAENVELLVQYRDSMQSIMEQLGSMKGVMGQMPPLPVQPNFELANRFLPKQSAAAQVAAAAAAKTAPPAPAAAAGESGPSKQPLAPAIAAAAAAGTRPPAGIFPAGAPPPVSLPLTGSLPFPLFPFPLPPQGLPSASMSLGTPGQAPAIRPQVSFPTNPAAFMAGSSFPLFPFPFPSQVPPVTSMGLCPPGQAPGTGRPRGSLPTNPAAFMAAAGMAAAAAAAGAAGAPHGGLPPPLLLPTASSAISAAVPPVGFGMTAAAPAAGGAARYPLMGSIPSLPAAMALSGVMPSPAAVAAAAAAAAAVVAARGGPGQGAPNPATTAAVMAAAAAAAAKAGMGTGVGPGAHIAPRVKQEQP